MIVPLLHTPAYQVTSPQCVMLSWRYTPVLQCIAGPEGILSLLTSCIRCTCAWLETLTQSSDFRALLGQGRASKASVESPIKKLRPNINRSIYIRLVDCIAAGTAFARRPACPSARYSDKPTFVVPRALTNSGCFDSCWNAAATGLRYKQPNSTIEFCALSMPGCMCTEDTNANNSRLNGSQLPLTDAWHRRGKGHNSGSHKFHISFGSTPSASRKTAEKILCSQHTHT